jgi:endonuclease YncB( thermonuclease family)
MTRCYDRAVRSPKSLLIWLVIIAIGAAIAQYVQDRRAPSPAEPPKPTGNAIAGRARVVDGDSLIIGASRIRLFGIDAPEGRQDCRDAQGRSYRCGESARRALADLIGGREVSCTPVGASHDRSVALCTAQDRDLSEEMVRGGHALELRQHSHGRYAAAERDARESKRGLWAGDFERPGQWRADHAR